MLSHSALASGFLLLALFAHPASMARTHDAQAPVMKDDWKKPDWCHGKDCPQFELLQTNEDVQLRRYAPGNWVTVNTTGTWDEAYSAGQEALSEYKGGKNEANMKLDNTVPTLTVMFASQSDARAMEAHFTISYFVPYNQQASVPKPTQEGVAVYAAPQQDVWVLTFGGFATEADTVDKTFAFRDELKAQGQVVKEDVFGVSIYDMPVQILKRHNEIWVWTDVKPSVMKSASAQATRTLSAVQRQAEALQGLWQRA